jgi:release factor glutamine methyltransferase
MNEPLTVLEVIKRTTEFFAGKGIESPRLNAEQLVGHALGLQRMQLYLQFERALTAAELEAIRPLVRRRGQREPMQYIIGETDFFAVKLKVDRRALIPRPETELLLELVTTRANTAPSAILDLGTGSGAIALGLARHFPEASVMAVDLSEEALTLARENSAEVAQTAPEVQGHEPAAALAAAEDGLADLRAILGSAPRYLAPGGWLALETGIAQHAQLIELASAAGFKRTESLPDLTGRDRFLLAWRD